MKTPAERFAAKWKADANGCWLWRGSLSDKGYGRFSLNGRHVSAHRWSYQHHVGPIPDGLVIDHLCRVRSCVNPAHMEPVTAVENTKRGNSGLWGKSKTHCPQGHPYDEHNTRRDARGARLCHICTLAKYRRFRERCAERTAA